MGVHNLVVDMCEVGGGEVFKMRYQGPDSDNDKVTVPKWALKHRVQARFLDRILLCIFFFVFVFAARGLLFVFRCWSLFVGLLDVVGRGVLVGLFFVA